jgi:hypothetical protein
MSEQKNMVPEAASDKPPIMNSWNQVYWLVILFNVVLVALLYWFTRAFA